MIAPDALLKTRQVALALGVSVSTIKRWVDSGMLRASRTVGKHRLIRRSEALRFAKEQGLPHADLELLVGIGPAHLETIDDRIRGRLLEALREGRAREARTLIRSAYASGRDGVALADHLIRPVMERIGHGWMVGALDVFQEHQSTQVVASSLVELIERVARPLDRPSTAPMALGATPEGDPYVLPGLLGELVLREGGWDVRNLGVNLPLRALANAVREYRPRLVFLSVSYLADEERFVREYASFYETAAAYGVAVILGGRALGPEIRARLVFASFGDRLAHLAEFARRLLPASEGATGERSD
jgi:excisionase family DNA binding protein